MIKKRYVFTLDKEAVDAIKSDFAILGLPPATLSNVVNEILSNLVPVVRRLAEKKQKGEKVTFEELAGMIVNTSVEDVFSAKKEDESG